MGFDRKKNKQAGFTLAELLIVVAIIAVLVAIAIPIFSTQLEKSKEATDIANVRAAYANVVAKYIVEGNSDGSMEVSALQGQSGWQTEDGGQFTEHINGVESKFSITAVTKPGKYIVGVEYGADGQPTVYFR